ncbi:MULTISPECIES: hypothetical protein [Flavobacteriaceae]|uniref:hypothetical protein n=1 Tax=Flavobacteriaceae TaxID=49546 RepID=UPI00149091ED|nr:MULTISPECIES: hypothetical protein [Allomuricauda]MDC6366695.1 hypothetical protein [Muricauda sp. AC10]
MKFSLVFTLLLFVQIAAKAQIVAGEPSNFESTSQILDVIEDKLNKDKVINYDLKDVVGSPYLLHEFLPGTMYLGKKNYGEFLFRYNIYRDEVELKASLTDPIESIKKINGVSIELENGTLLEVANVKNENTIERKFLIQLSADGKYKLAKNVYVEFDIPKEADTPLSSNKRAKFIKYEDYYIFNTKINSFIKVGKKKKEILKLFPNNVDAIEGFIANNKLNLKSEKDLISLFDFLNTSI